MTLRLYALVVGLALAITVLTGFAPGPKVSALGGAWSWAPDSSVAYRAQVMLSGALGPRDSIRYTFYVNNVAAVPAEVRSTKTDTTFTFAAPAYDATWLYKVCARVFRGTQSSGGFKCVERAFTRGPAPEPPAPVVDSLVVDPAQVSLSFGGVKRFCALFYLADGNVALDSIQSAIPECQAALARVATR